jgi:hypothetical protein
MSYKTALRLVERLQQVFSTVGPYRWEHTMLPGNNLQTETEHGAPPFVVEATLTLSGQETR